MKIAEYLHFSGQTEIWLLSSIERGYGRIQASLFASGSGPHFSLVAFRFRFLRCVWIGHGLWSESGGSLYFGCKSVVGVIGSIESCHFANLLSYGVVMVLPE
jgi:hypothetical protein